MHPESIKLILLMFPPITFVIWRKIWICKIHKFYFYQEGGELFLSQRRLLLYSNESQKVRRSLAFPKMKKGVNDYDKEII